MQGENPSALHAEIVLVSPKPWGGLSLWEMTICWTRQVGKLLAVEQSDILG